MVKNVSSEGRKNLQRGGETSSRTGILAKFGGRGGVTRKAIRLAKWTLSRQGVMPFTRPLLFDTQETRDGAVTGVTLVRSPSTRKRMRGGVMSAATLSTNNN